MRITAELDIFGLGRAALAKTRSLFGERACFSSARRLRADFTWAGPDEASHGLAEERLLGPGDLGRARAVGANALLCELEGGLAGDPATSGLRLLVRVPFSAGEDVGERAARLARLAGLLDRVPALDGIWPEPTGEAQGLDTLVFFAACRQACGRGHLVVNLESFGLKLGQLCLSFGADEISGSIVGQRALRLGERAASHDLTRDEAVTLLRTAGLSPCERLPTGLGQGV